MTDDGEIATVTLRQLVEAMDHAPDDQVFRWYQDSRVDYRGVPEPTITYRVTMAQARAELGVIRTVRP